MVSVAPFVLPLLCIFLTLKYFLSTACSRTPTKKLLSVPQKADQPLLAGVACYTTVCTSDLLLSRIFCLFLLEGL